LPQDRIVQTDDLAIRRRHWSPSESYAYCEQIAIQHYENFPVASWLIPRDKRKHIAAIYAFARTADDYADEPGYTPAERIDYLNQWEQNLLDCAEGEPTHPVFVALAETIERFQIPIDLFQNLLVAFRSDVTVGRYATFDQVLEYCAYSANPIGRLVLLLFNYRSETMLAQSDAICSALQLTNFWQDIAADLKKDRIYIPQDDMAQFGVSEQDILDRRMTTNLRKLLSYEVTQTERLFGEGQPLLHQVGRDLRFELRLTWNGGRRILSKIRGHSYDVFQKRPRLTTLDKLGLVFRTFVP
jgi:squalene synthase HpnC